MRGDSGWPGIELCFWSACEANRHPSNAFWGKGDFVDGCCLHPTGAAAWSHRRTCTGRLFGIVPWHTFAPHAASRAFSQTYLTVFSCYRCRWRMPTSFFSHVGQHGPVPTSDCCEELLTLTLTLILSFVVSCHFSILSNTGGQVQPWLWKSTAWCLGKKKCKNRK